MFAGGLHVGSGPRHIIPGKQADLEVELEAGLHGVIAEIALIQIVR